MLEPGKRRDTLEAAVARAVRRFGPRIYPFDTAAAEAAARLMRVARAAGLGIHQVPAKLADLQTAGIAIAHGLQLATRNIGDFQGLGLDLIDPWTPGGH
jgi:predicted nucleic acid-binding protein